jgi:flagellar biosynthesis chaperone FliJ
VWDLEESRKKLLIQSIVIGGIVGSLAVAFKSKSKMCSCLSSSYVKATEILSFVNENRSEIIGQLKTTSAKVTKAMDETNQDLKAITENIKHLKNSSSQMISTVQETKDALINMYVTGKENFEVEANQKLEEEKNA